MRFSTLESLGQHAETVTVFVGLLLEEHVVDEEAGADQSSLAPHVQVHWECDPKVIHVGEGLFEQASPLLADPAHLVLLIRSHHLDTAEMELLSPETVLLP